MSTSPSNPAWAISSPPNSAPASSMRFMNAPAIAPPWKQRSSFYRSARAAWAALSETAKGVYVPDITVGELPWLRGHWLDRLPAIDADIALLEKRLAAANGTGDPKVKAAIAEASGRPQRAGCRGAPSRPHPFSPQANPGPRTHVSDVSVSPTPLSPRQPGRALAIHGHGPQGAIVRSSHPGRLYRLALSAPILFRTETGTGSRLALPRLPQRI